MQISQVLKTGIKDLKNAGISQHNLEAEILLLAAIVETRALASLPTREWLIANSDYHVNNKTIQQFNNFLKRRMKFEPIAFITNHKEFYGYDFYVDKRVLIPRPESEILVERALSFCHSRPRSRSRVNSSGNPDLSSRKRGSGSPIVVGDDIKILELGTGSGCIIISLIKELQKQKIDLSKYNFTATDISQDALDVAQKNAKIHKVDQLVQFIQSDLFSFVSDPTYYLLPTAYSLVIANLPYVPSYWIQDGPTEYGLVHEPKISLDGGPEGLDIYEKFFKEVPKYLAEDGTILIECEDDQIEKILEILKDLKYKFSHQVFKDYNGLQRVIQIDKIKT